MNDIPPIQSAGQMTGIAPRRAVPDKPPAVESQGGDQLEISETGQILSSLGSDTAIRADKVAQIRQAIADGTYETQDRIDTTVDRLLSVLRSTSVSA